MKSVEEWKKNLQNHFYYMAPNGAEFEAACDEESVDGIIRAIQADAVKSAEAENGTSLLSRLAVWFEENAPQYLPIDGDGGYVKAVANMFRHFKKYQASQAVLPDGWVAVPKEPTSEMIEAADSWALWDTETVQSYCYERMLTYAPPCPILTEAQVAAKARREVLEEAALLVKVQPYHSDFPLEEEKALKLSEKIRALIEKGDA